MDAQSASELEEWLTPEEALEYLARIYKVEYHPTTLRRKAKDGEIPSRKIGGFLRFSRSDLDAWAIGDWKPEEVPAVSP